jgi:lipopolysaccharide/colanic/teichoic acid biosynthesis glycosyltransferase
MGAPIPFWKRLTDIVICGAALIVAAPLLLLAAIVVKLSSPGPVFYVGKRAGLRGEEFGIWKFRTMHVGSDRVSGYTGEGDPRVFPAGRLLRLFKMDELPQIFNILRGEMSVVGPRPEDLSIVRECYSAEQMEVLSVPPGLVGIPQVRYFPDFCHIDTEGMSAEEHYRKVILPFRLQLDLEYVRRMSLWYDIYLISATAFLLLFKTWYILLFGQKMKRLPVVQPGSTGD